MESSAILWWSPFVLPWKHYFIPSAILHDCLYNWPGLLCNQNMRYAHKFSFKGVAPVFFKKSYRGMTSPAPSYMSLWLLLSEDPLASGCFPITSRLSRPAHSKEFILSMAFCMFMKSLHKYTPWEKEVEAQTYFCILFPLHTLLFAWKSAW